MPTATPTRRPLKTHCPKGHELSPDNLVKKYLPKRRCLECYSAFFRHPSNTYDPSGDSY